MKNILVTGGTGYIGSHAVVELIDQGFTPIVVDNFVNSSPEVLGQIAKITGQDVIFYELDVRDKAKLTEVFKNHPIDAVIHFAGLKAVGESVEKPLTYYQNNIDSSLMLFEVMQEFGVNKVIFSSSATVYGNSPVPYTETMTTGVGVTNPYGRTKFMIEEIMKDVCVSNPDFQAIALRYFNPIGAHPSGLIGENPNGIPNNLLPYVMKVVVGELPEVRVFGNDYETADGTGVRDYIHVVDLVKGHIAALNQFKNGFDAYNLGTGHGASVLEIISATERAIGRTIPYAIHPRRAGDLPFFWADPTKSNQQLNWQAELTIDQACADAYKFIINKK